MENLVLTNVTFEEMEKAILETIGSTYNVKEALEQDMYRVLGNGELEFTFEMDDIKAEIELLDAIEIDEEVWENRFNVEIEKIEEVNEMNKELLNLKFEGNIYELSNKLTAAGCEDICEFGNWDEIIEDKNLVVATNEDCSDHIQIFFEVIHTSGEDENVTASIIKVTSVEEF